MRVFTLTKLKVFNCMLNWWEQFVIKLFLWFWFHSCRYTPCCWSLTQVQTYVYKPWRVNISWFLINELHMTSYQKDFLPFTELLSMSYQLHHGLAKVNFYSVHRSKSKLWSYTFCLNTHSRMNSVLLNYAPGTNLHLTVKSFVSA